MGRSLHRIRYYILFVLLISIFSLTALAEDSSAKLNSLHFEIALQEDGSARITETREVVFNGDREFTRYVERPEFSAWRKYMVYAVAMDRGQKLVEALTLKYPESHFTAEPSMDEELYRLLRELELHNAMNSIGRELADARKPGASSSSSDSSFDSSSFDNWSDSSGGGGGFSDFGGGSDSGSGGDFID